MRVLNEFNKLSKTQENLRTEDALQVTKLSNSRGIQHSVSSQRRKNDQSWNYDSQEDYKKFMDSFHVSYTPHLDSDKLKNNLRKLSNNSVREKISVSNDKYSNNYEILRNKIVKSKHSVPKE